MIVSLEKNIACTELVGRSHLLNNAVLNAEINFHAASLNTIRNGWDWQHKYLTC